MIKKKKTLYQTVTILAFASIFSHAQIPVTAPQNDNMKPGTSGNQSTDVSVIGISVMEKSLVGVGKMILNLREPSRFQGDLAQFPKVNMTYDRGRDRYTLTSNREKVFEVNAQTGAFYIQPKDAEIIAGSLIETSLAGIGAMIGALRQGNHPDRPKQQGTEGISVLVMPKDSLNALITLWQWETGSVLGSLQVLADLNSAIPFEQGRRRLRAGMEQHASGMKKLEHAQKKLGAIMEKLARQ